MNNKISTNLSDTYSSWLIELKIRIEQAQQRAIISVNQEQIRLYWQIGNDIIVRQKQLGWGAKVIERLAGDLKDSFPDIKGFSSSNLKYMRYFAESCPNALIGQQPADQLPWFHIVALLTKLTAQDEREWYAKQAIEHGWSRATLAANIKSQLHLRQANAVTNFSARLPQSQSELAREALKDPYLFDFLGLGNEAHERDIENGLIKHITKFLLGGSGATLTRRAKKIFFAAHERIGTSNLS